MNRSARAEASRNERGSSEDRRRRKVWLVETFRADVDLLLTPLGTVHGSVTVGREHESWAKNVTRHAACRCYRCGVLLTTETVTPDRIVPGCQGGTYRRTNLRPACLPCNQKAGRDLATSRRRKGAR